MAPPEGRKSWPATLSVQAGREQEQKQNSGMRKIVRLYCIAWSRADDKMKQDSRCDHRAPAKLQALHTPFCRLNAFAPEVD
jgi:hypothetical protein